MTDPREGEARKVLARYHKREIGFYAGPDILPKWCVAAMLAFADREREAMREVCAVICHQEASDYRHAQDGARTPTDKLYRMGQKDAALLLAAAIRNLPSSKGSEG